MSGDGECWWKYAWNIQGRTRRPKLLIQVREGIVDETLMQCGVQVLEGYWALEELWLSHEWDGSHSLSSLAP